MKSKRNLKSQIFYNCNCLCDGHFTQVQNNLSLTPRHVRQLTERGIAVSTQMIGQVDFGKNPPPKSLEPQYMRGCDLNTAWEISHTAKQRYLHLINLSKRNKNGLE